MTVETATLLGKRHLNSHVIECEFRCSTPVHALPGRYIMLKVGEIWRPFSIAEVRDSHILVLVVQLIEQTVVAKFFNSLKPDAKVELSLEMKGELTLPSNANTVFVATGTGIVPLYTIADYLLKNNYTHRIEIIFGAPTKDKLFYLDKLQQLEDTYQNCSVAITLSRPDGGWNGEKGRVGEYIRRHLDEYDGSEFYLCGRRETVDSLVDQLKDHHIPASKIHFIE